MNILDNPLVVLPTCLGMAILLAAAAVHKTRERERFATILTGYGILPGASLTAAIRAIPIAEAGLAVAVLIPATRTVASILISALLLTYGAAMVLTLIRGTLVVDCGCSVGPAVQRVSLALVWRNVMLALLTMNVALATGTHGLNAFLLVAIGLATMIACALYAVFNTLIATQHVSRELLHD